MKADDFLIAELRQELTQTQEKVDQLSDLRRKASSQRFLSYLNHYFEKRSNGKFISEQNEILQNLYDQGVISDQRIDNLSNEINTTKTSLTELEQELVVSSSRVCIY